MCLKLNIIMGKVKEKDKPTVKPKGTFNGSVSIPNELAPIWEQLKSSNRSGIVRLILKTAELFEDPNEVEIVLRELYYNRLKVVKGATQSPETE